MKKIRVLWLSGNPSLFDNRIKGNNNGGWISSLQSELENNSDIELAVSFLYDKRNAPFAINIGKTTYYPITLYTNKCKKILHNLFYENYDKVELMRAKEVIENFKPDIIHIWGTEISFGLLSDHFSIPIVIHVQGLLNPVFNAFFPPGVSVNNYLKYNGEGWFKYLFNKFEIRFWKHNIKRENEILKKCKYILGRTLWDYKVTRLLAPNSLYFHCDEVLRDKFYLNKEINRCKNQNKIKLITVVSKPLYKGVDLILKVYSLLKELNVDFVWNIYGVSNGKFQKEIFKIKYDKSVLIFNDVVGVESLIEALSQSDILIHPSYIDNSPNSICEAQFLGLPVISTNVGGISSLIDNYQTGILVPANDPYLLVSAILELNKNSELYNSISVNSINVANKRHDKDSIMSDLFSAYCNIISNEN